MALTGFAYPLAIDPITKGLKLASDEAYISQQIRSFVETELGERLGLPEYGLQNFLFNSSPSVGFVARDLEDKLPKYIPQATFRCQSSVNDAGEMTIDIFWTYQGTEQEPLRFAFEG